MPALPERVLIANRGEIAVRVTRTCHAAGIEVVAVYPAEDESSPHVAIADHAVPVPSYLDTAALVEAASSTGADAVHPGYGFLSESPHFARSVAAASLMFIGPPAGAMEIMGDKTKARAAMVKAGVPVVPGSVPGDAEQLAEAADTLGFPVLLKAVSGGGGKGMFIVHDRAELTRLHRQATDEARRSFGDGALYVEKLIERPRHVEVQIFADSSGSTVALGERECSIQRRHQKIIEETPSPGVDAELRRSMSAAAVDAARTVGYVGAGTVEFLLTADGSFYFLEMNTRLQVEHPVTEWVTGLDLVRLQLEVACGRPLPAEAVRPRCLGHALECRVYAEDPAAGYLPQSGRILLLREPAGPGVRVDSALKEGLEISVHYDPMLAKVSTWGRNRTVAIARMQEALRRFVLLGLRTNIDHLQDVLALPAFVEADLSTAFLDEHLPVWPVDFDVPDLARAATVLAGSSSASTPAGGAGSLGDQLRNDPWRTLGDFRIASRPW